jgi:hypothetical protein
VVYSIYSCCICCYEFGNVLVNNNRRINMKWVQVIEEGLPIFSGWYFWKGKNCGGYAFFDFDSGKFEIEEHVDEEHLCWLNENE